jgi:hypothetical protein
MDLSIHHVPETDEVSDNELDEDLTDEQLEQRRQRRVQQIAMETLSQMSQQQLRWEAEQHSVQSDPDSYGTICFEGFGQEASRKAPVSSSICLT